MKARILIIDDVVCVRVVLRRTLERSGHVVLDASSAFEGIGILRRESIDLIITDLIMPNESGFFVFDQCAQISEIPIFAMTSNTNESFLKTAYTYGFKEVFPKPIDYALLNKLIDKHCDPASTHNTKVELNLPSNLYNAVRADALQMNISVEELLLSRISKLFEKEKAGAFS